MNRWPDILIVDDDLFTASLTDFLTAKDFRVRTALTGTEGLESFQAQQSPLVLLDQELPDMGGIDICRKILELDRSTKIIFITAYATVEYAVDAMQAGADALLEQAKKEGMTTLKQDCIMKVFQGWTDMSEVRRVCIN